MPGPKLEALTPRQYAFLLHYMEHGKATEAYRAVYGASRNPQRDYEMAQRALKRPCIVRALAVARSYAERRLATQDPAETGVVADLTERYAINKERAAQMMATLAATDARDYFEWGPGGVIIKDSAKLTEAQAFGVIEVSQTIGKGGKTIRVKLADKQAALMNLARLRGWLANEDEPPPLPLDEEKRRVARQRFLQMLTDLAKPEPLVIEGRSTSPDK